MDKPQLGIIGAGQLGRMLALAAYPLGIRCHFLDTQAASPGGQLAPIITAALDDFEALRTLAERVDVLTFDIENVAVDMLQRLSRRTPVLPQPDVVAVAQDRLAEKQLFRALGIPTADFVSIDAARDLARAAAELGWPIVLKARRLGYDGRGQRIAANATELAAAWDDLKGVPAIAEAWVNFDRELSLIGARSASQGPIFYPLSENTHREGILVTSVAPYEDPELQRVAQGFVDSVMARFDYQGILTIELFQTEHGLVANEIAPRVHNSGHWTIEGAETSQFENHLRAVLDWPLGATDLRGYAGMVNFLGSMPSAREVLSIRGAHLHCYGKEARPARKVGHCTLLDEDKDRLLARLEPLRRLADEANQ